MTILRCVIFVIIVQCAYVLSALEVLIFASYNANKVVRLIRLHPKFKILPSADILLYNCIT